MYYDYISILIWMLWRDDDSKHIHDIQIDTSLYAYLA